MSTRRTWLPLIIYLVHALLWVALLPPWQGPDEPGHYEYARLLAQLQRPPQRSDANPALQHQILVDLDRHAFWHRTHQPRPIPLPTRFQNVAFLARSGSQLGNETPLYYLVPAVVTYISSSPQVHLYLGRLWSVLLGAFVVLAAIRGSPYSGLAPEVREVLPWLVALLPMPTFIHAIYNSNVWADLVGAWFFVFSWRLLSAPQTASQSRWGSWVGFAGLALISLVTKRTTWLLFPLALWAFYLMPVRRLRRYRPLLPLSVLLGLFLLLLFPTVPSRATGWIQGREQNPAPRVPRPGNIRDHALLLIGRGTPRERPFLAQDITGSRLTLLRGKRVRFRVDIRSLDRQPRTCISIADARGRSTTCGRAGAQWRSWTLERTVSPRTSFVRVVIGLGYPHHPGESGILLVDHARLDVLPVQNNVLLNGDAEMPLNRIRHLVKGTGWAGAGPQSGPERLQHLLLAGAILFTSFWGNFGWLQYPLPLPIYILLALVSAVALVGAVKRVFTCHKGASAKRVWWFHLGSGTAYIALNLLSALQTNWYPQGRYLFPALLPLLALGLLGLEESGLLSGPRRSRKRLLILGALALSLTAFAVVLKGMY